MKPVILAAALSGLASTAGAQTAPSPTPAQASAPLRAYGEPIRLETAQALLTAALQAARDADLLMAIAVVEPSGELVAFARMDDVQYVSLTLAQDKARSSARFRQATMTQQERVMDGRIVLLGTAEALPLGGGVPIVVEGRVIGAIGVSGGSAAQDHEIAEIAIATLP
ncbi:GlcG/HbpS family heme-binding protein [Brevundimonas sp.]|uniref:GlcG/HbpS family heme-binding protein n=1 Tax=Brevundimonas sp. TaxID=1871086 RepID=UPI003BA92B51